MSDKLNELLAGIIADRLPPQWADNSGEVMRWKRIAKQQRVALSIAIEKLQRLQKLEEAGLVSTGFNPKTGLVEIVEIPAHPWFVGVQYHPEYKSTVLNPHPLFVAFVAACLENK